MLKLYSRMICLDTAIFLFYLISHKHKFQSYLKCGSHFPEKPPPVFI